MIGMSPGGVTPWRRGHAVTFYALDTDGIDAVAGFVATGWAADECVIVVATEPHRTAVDARLRALGHDPDAERRSGRLFVLDAESTLRRFFVDGHLDLARLSTLVSEALERAGAGSRPVRIFGEMVAMLWALGEVEAAIELELHWNELLRRHDFSLLCSYPTDSFQQAELVDVRRICDLHTDLLPQARRATVPEGDARIAGGPGAPVGDDQTGDGPGHACSRVYLPAPESVPAARHFVVDVLRAWGHDELAADAALIVSELATNALRHAHSPFRAVVDQRRGGLRIGVEDASELPLSRRDAGVDAVDGRGVEIVAALARHWGSSPLPGGKIVWAELGVAGGTTRAG